MKEREKTGVSPFGGRAGGPDGHEPSGLGADARSSLTQDSDIVERLREFSSLKLIQDGVNEIERLRADCNHWAKDYAERGQTIDRLQREVKALRAQRDTECERANRLAEFIRTKGLARDYDQWREPRVSDEHAPREDRASGLRGEALPARPDQREGDALTMTAQIQKDPSHD